MWTEYKLFSLKGHAARLGGGEKDFSMLFTYAVADFYQELHIRLAFTILLITSSRAITKRGGDSKKL